MKHSNNLTQKIHVYCILFCTSITGELLQFQTSYTNIRANEICKESSETIEDKITHLIASRWVLKQYMYILYRGGGGGGTGVFLRIFENENLAIFAGNSQKDPLINYSKLLKSTHYLEQ